MINKPRGAFMYRSSVILGLPDSGLFHGILPTILGSQSDFHGYRTPRCAYVLVVKTLSFGRFSPISWTITQFWGPEVISTIDEPWVRLRVGHQHSQLWPILARFLDYYSPFWGPDAISIVVEP